MIPDIQIEFTLGGQSKTLDFRNIPISAWSELKRALKFTPQTLMEAAFEDGDIEAVCAIIWLERKQRERKLPWRAVLKELDEEVPDVEIEQVTMNGTPMVEPDEEEEPEEDQEEEEPDPLDS